MIIVIVVNQWASTFLPDLARQAIEQFRREMVSIEQALRDFVVARVDKVKAALADQEAIAAQDESVPIVAGAARGRAWNKNRRCAGGPPRARRARRS